MRVNWFLPVQHTNYNRMPASVWIRCLQLLPYLSKLGVDSAVNQPERKADVAIFVRLQSERTHAAMLQQRKQGAKVVFDLVVNYFEPSGPVAGLGNPVSLKQTEVVKKLIGVADAVTCASQFIADKASEYHACVLHLPDSINFKYFKYHKSEADFLNDRLIGVWSGVESKTAELEMILPLLKKHQIDLHVITNKRPKFIKKYARIKSWFGRDSVKVQYGRWRYQTFPQQLIQGHFGLSPRHVDSPYNRGHSSFKIGVFLAQGMPVFASSVPSYITLMGDRQSISSGRFCDTLDEWDMVLGEISKNRDLLISCHRQARKTAEAISSERIAQDCYQFLKSICSRNC